MADNQPVLFRKVLGGLRPTTPAAEHLLTTMDASRSYRVAVTGIRGNTKRIALYFVCLKVATEQLSDAVDGILSVKALHRWLKRDLGLAKPIVSHRTGKVIDYDYESISFEKMSEAERAEFVTAALERLSGLIGCDVTALRDEAQAQFGDPQERAA